MFKIFTGAHKATITHNYAKVSKERMVNRIGSIQASLKTSPEMPKTKKANLKAELKGILGELGAREEAIEQVLKDLI